MYHSSNSENRDSSRRKQLKKDFYLFDGSNDKMVTKKM